MQLQFVRYVILIINIDHEQAINCTGNDQTQNN